MMTVSGTLGRGTFLQRENATWVIKLCKDETFHLENTQTGEFDRISRADCMLGCVSGSIRPVAAPGAELDEKTRTYLTIPLEDFTPKTKAAVMRKATYIEAFQDPIAFYDQHLPDTPAHERVSRVALSSGSLRQLLSDVARATSDKKPPHASTFIRWYNKWSLGKAAGNADMRVLVDGFSSQGPKPLMSPRVKRWLDETIDTVFLQLNKPTRKKVFEVLREKIRQWNKDHPDEKEVLLSLRQVQRHCNSVDQLTTAIRRDGKQAASRRFKPVGRGPDPDGILDVVEVDHTRLDLELVDKQTGHRLGRPWLTLALDRYSRIILAAHVHFDGPSLVAVTKAIRETLLPATFPADKESKVKDLHKYYGLPLSFFFDRGTDFDSAHTREIGRMLDVQLKYEAAGVPQMKGRVERVFGTLQRAVCHPMPGARPPLMASLDQSARNSAPVMTLEAFKARMWKWILGVYVHQKHDGLGMTPAERWAQSLTTHQTRAPRAEAELTILKSRIEFCRVTNKGIRKNFLRWNGKALETIRSNARFKNNDLVKVCIDDDDLGSIEVVDPYTAERHLVAADHPEYMNGLSMYQRNMVLNLAKEKGESAADDEALLNCLHELHAEAAEYNSRRAGKKGSGKAAISRFQNVGKTTAEGDNKETDKRAPAPQELDIDDDDEFELPVWKQKDVRKS